MDTFLAEGQLLVVETESDRYLGTAEVVADAVVIRNGFVGHPTTVRIVDVEAVTIASGHPDVDLE